MLQILPMKLIVILETRAKNALTSILEFVVGMY